MSDNNTVEGCICRVETKNGRTRLTEIRYRGYADKYGRTVITAGVGKSRPCSAGTELKVRVPGRAA